MKKYSRILMLVLAAAIVGATSSCSLFKGKKAAKQPTATVYEEEDDSLVPPATGTGADESQIAGEWTVWKVGGQKVTGEERPYITFNLEDHRLYGNNGCNVVNAGFKVGASGAIQISGLISTMRACADAPFEAAINQALDAARFFTVSRQGHEYYMELSDQSHKNIMTLRRHNMDFLNGSWTIISIDGYDNSNEDIEMVLDIPELRIHGNTGCNIVNGGMLIDPDKSNSIQFENLATTRMACPPEIMKQETAFLVALEKVEFAKKGKNHTVIMTDKNGNQVLVLRQKDNPRGE